MASHKPVLVRSVSRDDGESTERFFRVGRRLRRGEGGEVSMKTYIVAYCTSKATGMPLHVAGGLPPAVFTR